jgi:hypothetical protein
VSRFPGTARSGSDADYVVVAAAVAAVAVAAADVVVVDVAVAGLGIVAAAGFDAAWRPGRRSGWPRVQRATETCRPETSWTCW